MTHSPLSLSPQLSGMHGAYSFTKAKTGFTTMRRSFLALLTISILSINNFGCGDDTASPVQNGSLDASLNSDGFIDGQDGAPDCIPAGERCDNSDNDCDGRIDEDFQIGAECMAVQGGCTAQGMWTCSADGLGADCIAESFAAEDEICDERDNDCDGNVDETFILARDLNNCGACGARCELDNAVHDCVGGLCVIQSCLEGFSDVNESDADGCECQIREGGEACNELDDDCDGSIDEGLNLGAPCTAGDGVCQSVGELSCNESGEVSCNAAVIPPSVEICNGFDDDCDGSIDEDFDEDRDGAIRCPEIDCSAPCPDEVDCEIVCTNFDCNDQQPDIGPSAVEICADGIDQNCDGVDSECGVSIARVTEMTFPGRDEVNCRDFDGDGVPDNAFAVIAPIINATVTRDIDNRSLNQMGLIYGLSSSEENRRFDFGLALAGRDGNSYRLSPETLDDSGRPLNFFGGATIQEGALSAGPRDIVFTVPVVGNAVIELPIRQTMVTGELTLPAGVGEETGFVLENGWVTGIVREDEFRQRALPLLSPEFVALVDQLFQPDLDTDGDGEDESFGMCVGVTMAPSSLAEPPAQLNGAEER